MSKFFVLPILKYVVFHFANALLRLADLLLCRIAVDDAG